MEVQRNRGFSGGGANIVVPGLRDPDATIQNFTYGGLSSDVRQIGAFVNLDLDYKGRYIVGGLIRRDGASLFAAEQRWKTYGRGSVAWRMSETSPGSRWTRSPTEVPRLDRPGRQPPAVLGAVRDVTIGAGGSLNPEQLGNANLRPEVATEREIGFDMEILNRYRRISILPL